MPESYLLMARGVLALGNWLTRAAPFLFFSRRRPPRVVLFVERNFPPIILTILILYTLGSVKFDVFPHGMKELAAIGVTMLLHVWRGNYLLSIFGGTLFYMFLVQAL